MATLSPFNIASPDTRDMIVAGAMLTEPPLICRRLIYLSYAAM